jgi:tetratricopeptide (TPR) repeat protein
LFWNNLGDDYKKAGRYDKAIEAYQEAIRLEPEYAWHWSSLGDAYKEAGQYDKAIEAYQEAIRIEPKEPLHWRFLGDAYKEAGQVAQELEVQKRVESLYQQQWKDRLLMQMALAAVKK